MALADEGRFAGPDMLVSVQENTDVASARRTALALALKLGFNEEDSGAVAVIATEAASNLVKHGGGGDLIVRDATFGARRLLEVIAIDRGRGMTSIARCFEDGYSTAGSPGTGLGAISRLSKLHDVYSIPEKGTVLIAQAESRAPAGEGSGNPQGIEVGAINIPYPGEEISGDSWTSHVSADRARFMIADGLGHGVFAAEAAMAAIRFASDSRNPKPTDVIESGHLGLRSTRGAAVGVADIDFRAGIVMFAGVGNVAAAVVSEGGAKRQMVSINGTLGHQMVRARQYDYPFPPGSLLIMHSDGLSANWSFEKYPGLFRSHPSVIAGVLFRDFRRTRDDATVVVARRRGPGT